MLSALQKPGTLCERSYTIISKIFTQRDPYFNGPRRHTLADCPDKPYSGDLTTPMQGILVHETRTSTSSFLTTARRATNA
jgi:hypothetical protein